MARQIRVDIVGDSGRFDKAALAAAAELEMLKAELKGTGHNFEALNTSIRDSSGKLDPFTKDMQMARKASLDAGDALLRASKLSDEAGKALGDLAPNARTAGKETSFLASAFGTVGNGLAGVFQTSIPIFGTVGTLLAGLPVIIAGVVVVVIALADAVGALIAVVADLVAPLTLAGTLLGGLGAAFAYVTVQSFKNKATLQDQKDALLALHVAQQTYNQDLAKYGKTATQTESALLALHKAQDAYEQAQLGAALGATDLGGKLHDLGVTLSKDFAPLILKGAQAFAVFLSYLNKIAKLPLKEAFQSFATTGVKMIGSFVDGVAKVIARPIRLAFKIAFDNATFSNEVSDWWHRFTGFLFGESERHPIKLGDHVIGFTTKHVDGIFQPLIDWFNRHDFTKQGRKIGHSILNGFTGSGASQRIGKVLAAAFGDALKAVGRSFVHLFSDSGPIAQPLFHMLRAANGWIIHQLGDAWHAVGRAAGAVWQEIQNKIHQQITTIIGWWHKLVSIIESALTVHINFPSPPSWLSGLGGLVPHLASGGIVTKPTLALIGEAGPEAVIPLHRAGSHAAGGTQKIELHVYLDGREIRNSLIRQGTMSGQPVLRGT
ncbi:MAG: hypothetical protein ACRDQZ_18535 [Mycobacteriales bacterium]